MAAKSKVCEVTIKFSYTAILILAACMITACVTTGGVLRNPIDVGKFEDRPIPEEAAQWLVPGPQTEIGPYISEVSVQIRGDNRRERLFKAVDYVWTEFQYDSWYNDKAFSRTADELFESRHLGGCADYALAQVALFRAVGIPARMVMTGNVDWMLRFQKNDLWIPTGHVFIEAWLEDSWHLVDSTYRYLFTKYDMTRKSYPRNEYFFFRAKDYWSLGVDTIDKLVAKYRPMVNRFEMSMYQVTEYPKVDVTVSWK
ncbi:hypothetical protein D3OALGA1CA_1427 [Olavius algarvensis associated proteobacterium Delta 3]|nr:hypothetical protein D3OALGB2SA_875 [Olavius algarvensis associated proteobacterium Delta 3]CAB5101064.1 hypothetical protein D3OALGA1CA_1427 [Olavius algarvensis associated proteobacterium Delta 3]